MRVKLAKDLTKGGLIGGVQAGKIREMLSLSG